MTKKRSIRYRHRLADWFIFVTCSICASGALGLYYQDINSFSLKNNEKTVAIISFKRNTVQRKFIDNDIWEKLNNLSPVYNGDKIRTSTDSEVFADFETSGSKVQLNENSLIQIFDNKKEKAIEFIGGEILLSSGTEESEFTTRVGKKQISASPNSKVKIAINNQAPQEAVVEVLEGQVEIDDIQKGRKKSEGGAEILKAGEQAVMNVAVVGKKSERRTAAKTEAASEDKGQKVAQASQPVEAIQEEEEPASLETIAEGFEAAENFETINFAKSGRNFVYSIPLEKLFGADKNIPAGAVIDLKFAGASNKNLTALSCVFYNGTSAQKAASAEVLATPADGNGLRAGMPFSYQVRLLLKNKIASTSRASLALAYDSKYSADSLSLSGFSIEAKVAALDAGQVVEPLAQNHKSAFSLGKITLPRVPLEKNSSGFELFVPTEKIWGQSKRVPKGSKIKLDVTGVSSLPLEFMDIKIGNCEIGKSDIVQKQRVCEGGVSEIAYSGTITIEKDIKNSDSSLFEIVFNTSSKDESRCQLSNVKVTVQAAR